MFENLSILGVILAAAVVGIGTGIGSAIGTALYKVFFEDRVMKFLDKKHREEALRKLMEKPESIIFKNPQEVVEQEQPKINTEPKDVVNKILGQRR